jgi:hypothetical protein
VVKETEQEVTDYNIVAAAMTSAFTIRSEIGGKTLGEIDRRFKLAHCIEGVSGGEKERGVTLYRRKG